MDKPVVTLQPAATPVFNPAVFQPPVPRNPLLTAPVATTLVRLAAPNLLGMIATTAVSIAETAYLGHLGAEPLAAAALVLPFIMLMGMMSAGAMGGGVSSAVSRALGAGDEARARDLARHALVIGAGMGLGFTLALSLLAAPLFQLLGGRGGTLRLAIAYGGVVFLSVWVIWLSNMFASVLRGSGDMVRPSVALMSMAALYLRFAGPAFIFFGLSLALYFSSQGAGRVWGPLLAGTARLLLIAVGGWALIRSSAPSWALFALVAAGMVAMGSLTAAFVALTPWDPQPSRVRVT